MEPCVSPGLDEQGLFCVSCPGFAFFYQPPSFRSRIKPELSEAIFGTDICKEGGEDTEERMEEELERSRERMPLLRFSRL